MLTNLLAPPPAIAGFVSSIMIIEHPAKAINFALPLFANGAPTIIFHDADKASGTANAGNLTLYGQTITPAELIFNEAFTLIAYFLRPHAMISLFDLEAQELTNGYIDEDNWKEARAIDLEEQLLNEKDSSGRLQLLNDFIFSRSRLNQLDLRKINFATDAIRKNSGHDSLTNLKYALNITERSLQRLFEANVGISPRMYQRVIQFHTAFQQLNRYDFSKLTGLAFENGFADQSHFIRVFKEFTGLTPKQYLQKVAPYNSKF
jgi:AraC-like DNA-binding protein